MKNEPSIRRATPADASSIGRVHVTGLHETYSGIMPSEWLAARTPEERTGRWKNIIEEPVACSTIAVFIAEYGGDVCGFASCGRQRTEFLKGLGFGGEISAIYVLRRHQRRGIGVALMRKLISVLLEDGLDAAALWCLAENIPARRFYECLGGEFLLEQAGPEIHAGQLEIAYGWRSLASLAARLEARSEANADSQ